MKLKKFIIEKRSHPELNKKMSVVDQLNQYSNQSNIFVTFTEVPKVGINPGYNYNTPLGIYFYPIKNAIEYIDYNKADQFAVRRDYINVCKLKVDVDLQKYTLSDLKRDLKKLREKYVDISSENWSVIEVYVENHKTYTPGKCLWSTTSNLAYYLGHRNNRISHTEWHKLLLFLGYNIIVDYGQGIIHPNEPYSAVAMTIKGVTVLDTIVNTDKPEHHYRSETMLGFYDENYEEDEEPKETEKVTIRNVNDILMFQKKVKSALIDIGNDLNKITNNKGKYASVVYVRIPIFKKDNYKKLYILQFNNPQHIFSKISKEQTLQLLKLAEKTHAGNMTTFILRETNTLTTKEKEQLNPDYNFPF
jgi:hypothetical protein